MGLKRCISEWRKITAFCINCEVKKWIEFFTCCWITSLLIDSLSCLQQFMWWILKNNVLSGFLTPFSIKIYHFFTSHVNRTRQFCYSLFVHVCLHTFFMFESIKTCNLWIISLNASVLLSFTISSSSFCESCSRHVTTNKWK